MFHLVFESHDGRALVPIPKVSDFDTGMVASLKVLDPKWPIREADIGQRIAKAWSDSERK